MCYSVIEAHACTYIKYTGLRCEILVLGSYAIVYCKLSDKEYSIVNMIK